MGPFGAARRFSFDFWIEPKKTRKRLEKEREQQLTESREFLTIVAAAARFDFINDVNNCTWDGCVENMSVRSARAGLTERGPALPYLVRLATVKSMPRQKWAAGSRQRFSLPSHTRTLDVQMFFFFFPPQQILV